MKKNFLIIAFLISFPLLADNVKKMHPQHEIISSTAVTRFMIGENSLKSVNVSYGSFADRIVVEWDDLSAEHSYLIFRSESKNGLFPLIAESKEKRYEDLNITPGVKYYYKIQFADEVSVSADLIISNTEYESLPERPLPVIKHGSSDSPAVQPESSAEMTDIYNYSGFAIAPKPVGMKLSTLTGRKNDRIKKLSDKDNQLLQEKRLAYLQKFYMHSVKLTLAMSIAKPHFNDGSLVIFSDFDIFDVRVWQRDIYFYSDDGSYSVAFHGKKIFIIFEGADDIELRDILLRNAELYCVYSGLREMIDDTGRTRIIHQFDAVGLSTRYLKNDRDWKKHTIMLGNSRDDLKKLMNTSDK